MSRAIRVRRGALPARLMLRLLRVVRVLPAVLAGLTLLALVAVPGELLAQGFRVTGSTTLRYIEIRPLVRDSVPVGDADGEGLLRQLADGRIVRCIPGEAVCRDTRPGDIESTIPAIHDLEASVWGIGRGLRLFTQLRGRTVIGGARDLWPRSDDAFDVLAAYAELDREHFRIRAGRQWKTSGLGFYNFDGLSATARPISAAALEVYGGRTLLRGMNEPRSAGVLESVEAFAPPETGILAGAEVRYRPAARLAVSAGYQLDFRRDGDWMYSERAMADAALRLGGSAIDASLQADLGSGVLNEARLHWRSPPVGRFGFDTGIRRYRPYFELWTIWGAFSPAGFDEARAGLSWTPTPRLSARGEASYRRYDTVADEASFVRLRDEGWALRAALTWSPVRDWRIDTGYRIESGFGAARRDGNAALTRLIGDAGSVTLSATAFQRLYEFRLAEGTVVGFGAEAALRVSDRIDLFAAGTSYRHLGAAASSGPDWNQRRATLRLQWTVGDEPGLPSLREERP